MPSRLSLAGLVLLVAAWPASAKRTPSEPAVDQASLCRAIVDELVVETHKFDMLANGEDDIYDTVPAICLAVLRAYTLGAPGGDVADAASRPRKLLKLSADELDERASQSLGGAAEDQVLAMLEIKRGCDAFTDEWQQELSEAIYKGAARMDGDAIADQLCPRLLRPAPKPPKRAATAPGAAATVAARPAATRERTPARAKGSGLAASVDAAAPMDVLSMLRSFDTDGSIAQLIRDETIAPQLMLDANDAAALRGAQADAQLRCDVCELLVDEAYARVLRRVPGGLAVAGPDQLLEIVETLCAARGDDDHVGGGDEGAAAKEMRQGMPAWASEQFEARQDAHGRWRAHRLTPSELRARARDPGGYDARVLSTAALLHACRALVDEGTDDDDDELVAHMHAHKSLDPASARERVRATFCRAPCASAGKLP
jgi:hypothetical protein